MGPMEPAVDVLCRKCGGVLILTRTTVWCAPLMPADAVGEPCPPTCVSCGAESVPNDEAHAAQTTRWWREQGMSEEIVARLVEHRPGGRNNYVPSCVCRRREAPEFPASDAEL